MEDISFLLVNPKAVCSAASPSLILPPWSSVTVAASASLNFVTVYLNNCIFQIGNSYCCLFCNHESLENDSVIPQVYAILISCRMLISVVIV
ncbi:hypothetical protein RJT34_17840 [Clitoria ternatea]|uniref:Uncharacterized protein n=1 Tax=Clitoria ternatea TaxID=43366 RepID=A0AAN9JB06_CLITE